MESYFLCIFALATLPSVMAIYCYECTPEPPDNMCLSPTNATDCDKTWPPGTKFDACSKTSFEIEFRGKKLRMNAMSCTGKDVCKNMKEEICEVAVLLWKNRGINAKDCDVSCCYEDKCNGAGYSKAKPFIAAFLSVSAIFAGFFIH